MTEDREARLAEFRGKAVKFLNEAIRDGKGVRVNDDEYRRITERRDPGPGYSSCGDLAHALIEHLLGEKAQRVPWLNRASLRQYRMGMNVGRITRRPIGGGASGLARRMRAGEVLQTGDIAVMWARPDTTDAHVFVVDKHTPTTVESWDYGQGAMSREAWLRNPNQLEGCKRLRKVLRHDTVEGVPTPVLDGGKAIRSVLPLEALFDFYEGMSDA